MTQQSQRLRCQNQAGSGSGSVLSPSSSVSNVAARLFLLDFAPPTPIPILLPDSVLPPSSSVFNMI